MPVIRLARRQEQEALDAFDVEIEQEAAVEEQIPAFAALGVAGEFQVADGQIAVATHFAADYLNQDTILKAIQRANTCTLTDRSAHRCSL